MDQPVTTFGRRESASESGVGCVLAESNAALVAKEFDRALQIMRAAVAVNDAPELQLRRGVLEFVFGDLAGSPWHFQAAVTGFEAQDRPGPAAVAATGRRRRGCTASATGSPRVAGSPGRGG